MSDESVPVPVPADETAGRPEGDINPVQALRIEVEQLKVEIAQEKLRLDGERRQAEEEYATSALIRERNRLKAELDSLRGNVGGEQPLVEEVTPEGTTVQDVVVDSSLLPENDLPPTETKVVDVASNDGVPTNPVEVPVEGATATVETTGPVVVPQADAAAPAPTPNRRTR